MAEGFQFLVEGFKLDIKQRGLVIRVGWVALVTFHILWVCGWLAAMGLPAPYASANDLSELKQAAYVSARVNIATEIRQQVQICRAATDPQTKNAIAVQIDRLQEEYKKYANGNKYDAGSCQ